MNIVHIIPDIAPGGASNALADFARRLASIGVSQRVVALGWLDSEQRKLLEFHGIPASVESQQAALSLLGEADAAIIHYWHTARLHTFLAQELPPSRLILYCHIFGKGIPQCLTAEIVELADLFISASPATLNLPVLAHRTESSICIPPCGRFDTLSPRAEYSADAINVGYVGLVDFVKMHPAFVEMTAAVRPPITCDVWGSGGAYPQLKATAQKLGISDRFRWHGYARNVGDVFATLDIFGYPLAPQTYAAAELTLQEAMYFGLPPVVFDLPCYANFVRGGQNALVVKDEAEYAAAIGMLAEDRMLRKRLGTAAHATIREEFDPERSARLLFSEIVELVDAVPKRAKPARELIETQYQGASQFVRALGDEGSIFQASLESVSPSAADQQIATLPETVRNRGAGGLFDYRNFFSDDAMIAYWCALSDLGRGAYANALAGFLMSKRFGMPAIRVSHWISLSHSRLERRTTDDASADSNL
jgi:glycosyltransferase involved in cell wall biosynthesis